ncbi:MAG: methionine--tRNA ligase [Deltaproteobacteria bacterium]|nr:methionine--tRNA ligase [Deltaproteobacteria bacterium]
MSKNSFYVTTPIYYVNDRPHIGHAYTTVAADVLARFHRLEGEEVFFLTGTDEHGKKVEQAAQEQQLNAVELANNQVIEFKNLWSALSISNDAFIRTTEERHARAVRELWRRVAGKGEIYLGEYEDWYCTPCETYWTQMQLKDGRCPDCGRPVEKLKEASYFFRLSRYQEKLLQFYKENPHFIQPESRRNEVIRFVESGLRDLSISRAGFHWGIPVPENPKHVVYVWFDALANYLTAIGFPKDSQKVNKFWPADIHLVGKDILRFHAIYWPAFLMAAGLPLPKKIFAHGWWTVEGQKMSKSLRNVVNPLDLVARYGTDVTRYFLLREVPFGLDGDYSEKAIRERNNSDLANNLGNLVQRTLTLAQRNFPEGILKKGEPAESEQKIQSQGEAVLRQLRQDLSEVAFHKALIGIWGWVDSLNRYIDQIQPWFLAKDPNQRVRLETVLYTLLESLRFIAVTLFPFMPGAAQRLWKQLGVSQSIDTARWSELRWGELPEKLAWPDKLENLFPRMEAPMEEKEEVAVVSQNSQIELSDFKKVELRTVKVLAAKRVPEADKLLELRVDAGEERTVVAGIATSYSPENLVGKTIVIVSNLKPRKLKGIESQGMVLAVGEAPNVKVLTVDGEVPPGTRVK